MLPPAMAATSAPCSSRSADPQQRPRCGALQSLSWTTAGGDVLFSQVSEQLGHWPNTKEDAYTAGDVGSIPALGGSPGEGYGNPL